MVGVVSLVTRLSVGIITVDVDFVYSVEEKRKVLNRDGLMRSGWL